MKVIRIIEIIECILTLLYLKHRILKDCFSLSVCLCLSVCLSLSVSVSVSVCLCLSVSLQVRVVQEITGPRGTTLKERSWLTRFLMWCEKRPRAATVCRDSSWPIPWGEARVQAWEPCWFLKSVKSTRTGWWSLSAWYPPPRCRTLLWSRTTPLCLSISW